MKLRGTSLACVVLLALATASPASAASVTVFPGPTVIIQGEVAGPADGLPTYVLFVAQPNPVRFGLLRTVSAWCPNLAMDSCPLIERDVSGTISAIGSTVTVEAATPSMGFVSLSGARTAHGVPLVSCGGPGHSIDMISVGDEEVTWVGTVNGRTWLTGACPFYVTLGVTVVTAS